MAELPGLLPGEGGDQLHEAQGGGFAEVDLALDEGLEVLEALGLEEPQILDLAEHEAQIEEALVEVLAEGLDPLDGVVKLADAGLDLLDAGGRADRGAGAAWRRGFGGALAGLGGVLGGVARGPGSSAPEAHGALGLVPVLAFLAVEVLDDLGGIGGLGGAGLAAVTGLCGLHLAAVTRLCGLHLAAVAGLCGLHLAVGSTSLLGAGAGHGDLRG